MNAAEVGLDVVAAPVEVADKVAENKKVAEAGVESGEANIKKKSLIIFVEAYGQVKVALFMALQQKGYCCFCQGKAVEQM